MIVVSDTGPLRNLALLGYIDLLPILFGQVLIPHEVYTELTHPHTPPRVLEQVRSSTAWLQTRVIEAPENFLSDLDDGERAAIYLAQTTSADLVITDDLQARKAINQIQNLAVSGTLGVLYLAASLPNVAFSVSEFDAAVIRLTTDPELKFRSGPKLRAAIESLRRMLHAS